MRNGKVNKPSDARIRELDWEVNTLRRAAKILCREFGSDPKSSRELGYALLKGEKELTRELRRLKRETEIDRRYAS